MSGLHPLVERDGQAREPDHRPLSARNAFAGFAKAVAGTAFLIGVGTAAIMLYTSPEGAGFLPFFFFVALLGSMIGVAAAGLVIGLPLTWVLASNRLEGPWTYPPVGFLVGATLVLIVYNLVFAWAPREVIPMFLPLTLFGGLPGGTYGALWWHFYRRHMQDA